MKGAKSRSRRCQEMLGKKFIKSRRLHHHHFLSLSSFLIHVERIFNTYFSPLSSPSLLFYSFPSSSFLSSFVKWKDTKKADERGIFERTSNESSPRNVICNSLLRSCTLFFFIFPLCFFLFLSPFFPQRSPGTKSLTLTTFPLLQTFYHFPLTFQFFYFFVPNITFLSDSSSYFFFIRWRRELRGKRERGTKRKCIIERVRAEGKTGSKNKKKKSREKEEPK